MQMLKNIKPYLKYTTWLLYTPLLHVTISCSQFMFHLLDYSNMQRFPQAEIIVYSL